MGSGFDAYLEKSGVNAKCYTEALVFYQKHVLRQTIISTVLYASPSDLNLREGTDSAVNF